MARKALRSSNAALLTWAKQLLDIEANAISSLKSRLSSEFVQAVELIEKTKGHVVVTGIGKPGFLAQKLSATFASTGIPSHYLHPAEAAHGDLGRLAKGDVVIALSNSGATEELVRLLVPLKRLKVKLIVLTGQPNSPLGKAADILLDIGSIDEACPMGLVPTASSAALHAMSDALVMALAWKREFTADDYAQFHPGGKLGRSVMKVHEIMRKKDANPIVSESMKLSETVVVMTNTPGRPGAANVIDSKGVLVGIFTDGDLRRLAEQKQLDFSAKVGTVMSRRPRCIGPDDLVLHAASVMREGKFDQLPVVDVKGRPIGLVDVQDVLAARVV